MSQVKCNAIYKKKAGMLSIMEEETPPKLHWKCIDDSIKAPEVDLKLDAITHLQVSPATSENIVLKIVISEEAAKEMNNPKAQLIFAFNSRSLMDDIKGVLQQAISRKRTAAAMMADKGGEGKDGSLPPTDNIENDKRLAELLDADKLLKNLTLQQKLLTENSQLMRTFSEAVIKTKLDPEEFWRSRVHLLRSYAIQHNQKRGPYNVLSTIKPVASSENQVNVSVTREKIHEIFNQYPVVRKAYDDNVPKISEGEFWSRFFSSKLFRKLRGEKINLYDRGDVTMDKYLYVDPDYDGEEEDDDPLAADLEILTHEEPAPKPGKGSKSNKRKNKDKEKEEKEKEVKKRTKIKLFTENNTPVSKFIDIEANEEDAAEKYGNTPDITMKQDKDSEIVGVMRSMNRLSRRMMSSIKDDDTVDKEKENEEELEIHDLEETSQTEYNELNYTTRQKVDSSLIPPEMINAIMKQSPLNPTPNAFSELIINLKSQVNSESAICLQEVVLDKKKPIQNATKDISTLIKTNAKQSSQSWKLADLVNEQGATGTSTDENGNTIEESKGNGSGNKQDEYKDDVSAEALEIDPSVVETLRITHTTSIEFLTHFWNHFNSVAGSTMSSNPNFKKELIQLRNLYVSVTNCLKRVNDAVASLSEDEKTKTQTFMVPLIGSLNKALSTYESAIPGPKEKE